MNMTLNRRYRRSTKANLPFYIAASILTMLALLMFYLFYIAGTGINAYGDTFFSEQKLEDATFTTYLPIPDDDIKSMEKTYHLTMERECSVTSDEEDYTARVSSPMEKIDLYQVHSGRDLEKDDEILISAGYADQNKVKTGDKIRIENKEYTVCGTFLRPDYLYMLENLSDDYKNVTDYFLAYLTQNEFESRFGDGSASYKVIYSAQSDEDAFRRHIDDEYMVSGYLSADNNTRITFVHDQADMFLLASWIILVIFPLITVALISILIGRKIRSEQKLIGTLSAMGYRRGQLMRHYSLMAVIPGIIGGILTSAAALLLQKPFGSFGLADYEPMEPEFQLPLWVAVAGIVIPTLIYWLCAMLRVRGLLKKDTVSLLNGMAGKNKKARRILVHSGMKVRRKFAVRTLTGNPGRSFVIFLGIFLGAMMMAFAFSFYDSVQAVGDQAHGEFGTFKYEYVLNELRSSASEQTDDADDLLEDGTEPMLVLSFEAEKGGSVSAIGVDEDVTLWNTDLMDGGKADPEDGWYISTLAMELFDVQVGDTFTFRNTASLKEHNVKIKGSIKNGYQAYILSSREAVADLMDLDKETYNAILSGQELDLDEDIIAQTVTDKTYKNQMQNMLNSMGAITSSLIWIGAIICIAAVFVTVNMMLDENRYTISMLKVLGFKDRQTGSMIINSNHLLLIPGIALGVLAAYGVMYWYCVEFVKSERIMIPATLGLTGILITTAITAASYFISLWLVRRKVDRIDMVEALKDNRE